MNHLAGELVGELLHVLVHARLGVLDVEQRNYFFAPYRLLFQTMYRALSTPCTEREQVLEITE